MKKSLLCALAILLACVVAVPASAQSRRHSHRHYSDGYSGTALEAVTARNMGMVDGIIGELGYGRGGYNSRDYRYRDSDHRFDRGRGRDRSRRDQVATGLAGLAIGFAVGRSTGGHPTQQPQPNARVSDEDEAVFINCTHTRVFVGNPETGEGFYLNPGERGNAVASMPAYGKFDGQFRPARINWMGNSAQITTPEGE